MEKSANIAVTVELVEVAEADCETNFWFCLEWHGNHIYALLAMQIWAICIARVVVVRLQAGKQVCVFADLLFSWFVVSDITVIRLHAG